MNDLGRGELELAGGSGSGAGGFLWVYTELASGTSLILNRLPRERFNDVNDRVGFSDIAEELISQPFTLRGTFYEPRNIDELDRRGHDRLGMDEILELFEANVGDDDDPGVGLDRTEWIVLGLDSSRSECVENGALPDVREADDAASQCHGRRMFPNS